MNSRVFLVFTLSFVSKIFALENRLDAVSSTQLSTLRGNVFGTLEPPKNWSNSQIDVNWVINVPDGLSVYLQFISVQTSGSDAVFLYDGPTVDDETLLSKLYGSKNCPISYISSDTSLTVRFVGTYPASTFYASYSVPVTSGTMLKATTNWQDLTSPNYPNPYTSNVDIVWILFAPVNYNVEIRWQNFLTQKNTDLLTVYDGPDTNRKPYIEYSGNYTSTAIFWSFISTSNYLTVRFTSDDTDNESGFVLHYISFLGDAPTTTPVPATTANPLTTVHPPSDVCSNHGNYSCTCFYGYTGQNCQTEIDFCNELISDYSLGTITAGQLCGQHGHCLSSPQGATCTCDRGFTGPFCEDEVPNETFIATRCTLYATNSTVAQDVPVGCTAGLICIPDKLDCAVYQKCPTPLGWCLPNNSATSAYVMQFYEIFNKQNSKAYIYSQ